MKGTFPPTKLSPSFQVVVTDQALVVSPQLEKKVAHHWDRQKERLGEKLFDGQVLSVCALNAEQMLGQWVPYRYALAAYHDLEMAKALAVVPVGVNGVTRCRGEVLCGLRGEHVANFPNTWEMAPSGSLDPYKGVDAQGRVDYQHVLLAELHEEAGISLADVEKVQPLWALQDPVTQAVELVVELYLLECAREHFSPPEEEYSQFAWVAASKLTAFLQERSNVAPLPKAIAALLDVQ